MAPISIEEFKAVRALSKLQQGEHGSNPYGGSLSEEELTRIILSYTGGIVLNNQAPAEDVLETNTPMTYESHELIESSTPTLTLNRQSSEQEPPYSPPANHEDHEQIYRSILIKKMKVTGKGDAMIPVRVYSSINRESVSNTTSKILSALISRRTWIAMKCMQETKMFRTRTNKRKR